MKKNGSPLFENKCLKKHLKNFGRRIRASPAARINRNKTVLILLEFRPSS